MKGGMKGKLKGVGVVGWCDKNGMCNFFFQPSPPPKSQFFFRSIVAGDSTGHLVTSTTIQPASNHLQSWGPFLESPETFRAHFGWHNSLCIFKTIASRGMKLGSYFNFYSLYNISKDQPNTISVSRCYEWFFGSDKFSGLSRNGPREIGASFWRNPTSIVSCNHFQTTRFQFLMFSDVETQCFLDFHAWILSETFFSQHWQKE